MPYTEHKHADSKMRPFTLSFDKSLEADFRRYYHETSINHIRVALIVGFLFYSGFGVLDLALVPKSTAQLWFIRYALMCPSVALCFLATYLRSFERHGQAFLSMGLLTAGLGIVAMTVVAPAPADQSYYVGLILVLIYGFGFLKLQFKWAALAAWVVVVAYELGAVLITEMPWLDLVTNNFFLLSANVIGMFACYFIELHTRQSFFSLSALEEEKEKTVAINAQLEQEVAQRREIAKALHDHRDRLEEIVQERTSELQQSNEQLRLEIAQRKEAEDAKMAMEVQLRHRQKMEAIGTLAGGIAHDFNNILSAVVGYTSLTIKKLPENSDVQLHLAQVLKAGNRATDLVQQILTFSRQSEYKQGPVEIHLIVKEVLKLLRASIPATIEIRESVDTNCGAILADATQIHQVVMNLCTNAYQAMRETGGKLRVRLDVVDVAEGESPSRTDLRPGSYARLVVSDTGHGMDQATLDRVFEPFFTTKPIFEGTGMGLSIVHGIVTSLRGAIAVSTVPERGTEFSVYLPRVEADVTVSAADMEPVPRGTEHILFVDDEDTLADLGRLNLSEFGYRVTSETDSINALSLFSQRPYQYDLIITDHIMPRMTGAEMAVEMLRIRPNIPIILTTGYSEGITEEKAKGMGIRLLMMKPLPPDELARTTRRILDTARLLK